MFCGRTALRKFFRGAFYVYNAKSPCAAPNFQDFEPLKILKIWRTHNEILHLAEDADERRQERRHTRSDHKYAHGAPLSLDAVNNADDWIIFSQMTSYTAVELKIDLEMAMETLTDLQRHYFILNRMHGYSYADIARREDKSRMTIFEITEAAEKKIKNFFR